MYFTVAQVRFNPILRLGDFLAHIQEKFRLARFADFKALQSVVIQITVQEGRPVPMPQPHQKYSFGNAERTHSFLLDESTLTFQSTEYGDFDVFSEKFLEGLGWLNEIVGLEFFERVGLRYLDYVIPLQGEPLAEYLEQEAFGVCMRLSGSPAYSFCETLVQQGESKLLSRVWTKTGPVSFPPDLTPIGLELSPRFREMSGHHAMLDNDGFTDLREPFSLETVRTRLSAVHTLVRSAFRTIAKPYAFEAWNR